MNSTDHNPYFTFAWKLADKLNHLPRKRCTWIAIVVALALLAATVVSIILIHGNSSSGKVFCYTEVQSNGVTAYAKSDTPSTPATCTKAAANSGTKKLTSLPAGVTQVCNNGSVSVYMSQDQITELKNLGLDPASVCS
jgi:flagellar basal body-associated protein FliL